MPSVLTLEALREAAAAGTIDTVVLAVVDMQGRLQGKRLTASFFLDEVAGEEAEACNYLLAVDVDMNTVDGYAFSSWEAGYGDMVMRPDLASLRLLPWLPGTAFCLCDLELSAGGPAGPSPRQILRKQLDRLAERGWACQAATELEFILFKDTYEDAWHQRYSGLEPANLYNVDYSLLGTSRVEPLIRRIRNEMGGAGLTVLDSKGECNLGQHEINFRYADALTTADGHVVFKNGAKEIAAQEGQSITFMAKFDEREGSSCHVHCSLTELEGGEPVFPADDAVFKAFLAGQLNHLREFTLLYAPNVNSYKRFANGSFAPTAVAWGHDNRTCALRVVGHGAALRVENRLPGADVNPYLTLAAVIAAGLQGIDDGADPGEPCTGNAYTGGFERVPGNLGEAAALFGASAAARTAFGDEVVDHYVRMAEVELEAFGAAVTDWERVRGFERL